MSDSDPPQPSVHPRRRLPNPNSNSSTVRPLLHHSSSYHSASQSSSQPETPPFTDDYFQDAFSDLASAPTASRLRHFDTILNPTNSSGTDRFFSPPAWPSPRRLPSPRAHSPALPSGSAFSMSGARLPNGYVDLTHDPSSPSSPPPNPRRAPKRNTALHSSPESVEGPSTKRHRRNDGTSSRVSGTRDSPIEEVDLIDDDNDKTVLQNALQKQRLEQVKAQERPAEKPLKMSTLTCVICMDTPTDITATSCGHLFCHACLMEALIAGENRSGVPEPRRSQCPVCRKLINRTKTADIIPLLMMRGLATQPRKSATPKAA
ncbi:uncharacterized protein BDZ99DRAFT_513904 [Mytilinidion resinicola]|uniref:RING-type domain-containing protein n=1 Tax=Mytilinidion resinicola TaxID=574789 RepID=A0A6A6Z9I5_9PEZI|nr:uncharacterized protein BDZ99DRAFT_513904 [Mytilinidion resinicola]KAF2817676.1 hypothetical protein BDZ99DRAFT_513904 [Mytilinidion resinicola]